MRRIVLLTSGGDCAALRGVVHRAILGHGWGAIGIKNGTFGLLQQPVGIWPLSPDDFDETLIGESGIILGRTNTGNPFAFESSDGSLKDLSDEAIRQNDDYIALISGIA